MQMQISLHTLIQKLIINIYNEQIHFQINKNLKLHQSGLESDNNKNNKEVNGTSKKCHRKSSWYVDSVR